MVNRAGRPREVKRPPARAEKEKVLRDEEKPALDSNLFEMDAEQRKSSDS